MAFPRTISSTGEGGTDTTHRGPVKATNGNIYVVLWNGANSDLEMYSPGSDGDAVWSEQDAAGAPAASAANEPLLHLQIEGNIVHVVWRDATNSWSYNTFDATTDTWGTEAVVDSTSFGSGVGSIRNLKFDMRSDGDLIVTYEDDVESVHGSPRARIALAREEGAGWTIGVDSTNGNQGGVVGDYENKGHHTTANLANDRTHIYYNANGSLVFSTYLSGNTFGHAETAQPTGLDTSQEVINGVDFDDGGTDEVRVAFAPFNAAGGMHLFVDADDPSGSDTIDADFTDGVVNLQIAGRLLITGTTQFFVFDRSAILGAYRINTGAGDDTWADLTQMDVDNNQVRVEGAFFGTVLAAIWFEQSGDVWEYWEEDIVGTPTLSPNAGVHAHTVTSPALTSHSPMVVNNAAHAVISDSPLLTVNIVVNDAAHALTSSEPTLTFNQTMAPMNAAHALASTLPILTSHAPMSVDSAVHAHVATSPSLLSNAPMSVDNAAHAVISDSPTLTFIPLLTVNNALHSVTSSEPSLSTTLLLDANDTFHAVVSDSPSLTSHVPMAVDNAAHALASTSPVLSVNAIMPVNDAIHDHVATEPLLVSHAFMGSPDDAFHALASTEAVFVLNMPVDNAIHVHIATEPTLVSHAPMSPDDAAHAVTSDEPSLAFAANLIVDNALHALISTSPVLVFNPTMTPNDCFHALTDFPVVLMADKFGDAGSGYVDRIGNSSIYTDKDAE